MVLPTRMLAFNVRRSREGAWIEIPQRHLQSLTARCRSREGAWIEINFWGDKEILRCSRSREGAWIEIYSHR